MLKIRLSRTGKKSQPSFRIIVQEHSAAVKGGKVVEIIGHYQPTSPNKDVVVEKERVEHWISVGAQPSDTVAALLKRHGLANMEKFMAPRNKQKKSKKGGEEAK